mmetsp:Transcript_8514/g.17673  ORF Transcript_8514/g.17673 Transcript_8514/m.17673 type:complete len:226 (+) Transcript_8514:243-920(+)
MTLSDACGSNHRLKTNANLSAAEGDDAVEDDASVVDEEFDASLLSRITFPATLRFNWALAPMLRTEEDDSLSLLSPVLKNRSIWQTHPIWFRTLGARSSRMFHISRSKVTTWLRLRENEDGSPCVYPFVCFRVNQSGGGFGSTFSLSPALRFRDNRVSVAVIAGAFLFPNRDGSETFVLDARIDSLYSAAIRRRTVSLPPPFCLRYLRRNPPNALVLLSRAYCNW